MEEDMLAYSRPREGEQTARIWFALNTHLRIPLVLVQALPLIDSLSPHIPLLFIKAQV